MMRLATVATPPHTRFWARGGDIITAGDRVEPFESAPEKAAMWTRVAEAELAMGRYAAARALAHPARDLVRAFIAAR